MGLTEVGAGRKGRGLGREDKEEGSGGGEEWGQSIAHAYKDAMQSPFLRMLTKNVNLKRKKK